MYYEWLINKVTDRSHTRYTELLLHLFEVNFDIFIIERDENRAEWGKTLRYWYTEEGNELDIPEDKPCSILEMMIALADTCHNDTEKSVSFWFWRMASNLGIDIFDDQNYNENELDEMLERFLYRKYDATGHGSLFIVDDPPVPLFDVELWTQMQWAMTEFYGPDFFKF